MEVTLQQSGVYDLQELLAALDGGRSLHEWRGGGRVRVVQLLHQVAALLLPTHTHTRSSNMQIIEKSIWLGENY